MRNYGHVESPFHFTFERKKMLDVFLYKGQELNQIFSRKILFQANGYGLMRKILWQSILQHFFMLSCITTMMSLYGGDLINYSIEVYNFLAGFMTRVFPRKVF